MKDTDPKVNPWITMWFRPQRTIRAVININPKMGFLFLAAVWFLQFFFLFETYYSIKFPVHWALTILFAVAVSPFFGGICFYFMGWILYVTGKWMKGKALQSHTRCAFAWSRIPLIIDLVMWFAISFFVTEVVFAGMQVGFSFIFMNLIACSTSVWSFVLLVGAIKEIQKFSLIKALLNVIIVYLIISLIFFIISSVIYPIIF